MKKVKVRFYLDTRRSLEDGKYPLKILFYHDGQCLIPTEYDFTEKEWAIVNDRDIKKDQLFNTKGKNDSDEVLETIRTDIDDLLKKVEKAVKELEELHTPFKAIDVKTKLNTVSNETMSDLQYVYACYEKYKGLLEKQVEVGKKSPKTVDGYTSTMSVLKKYYEGLSKRNKIEKLRFVQIDVDFLNQYEKYLLNKGDSKTTVGVHNRYIRALFRFAINKGAIPQTIYPYGTEKNHTSLDGSYYTIHSTKKTKKALTTDELIKLLNYRKKGMPTRQHRNFDLAFLSFLMNGANMLDIAQLTYGKNYDKGSKTIHFTRTKTINETTDITEITVSVTKGLLSLIKKYGNENSPENHIFKILRPSDNTPDKIRKRVHSVTRAIGKTLKRIAKACGVREDISYQFFRHTHATYIITEANASIYDVMVSMGHKDYATTSHYVDTLPLKNKNINEKKEELISGIYG